MFYEIDKEIKETELENVDRSKFTVGIVKSDELMVCGKQLGLDEDTIEASQKANPLFRTGVDVRDEYTFAELKIVNTDGHEDFVSLYIMENLVLIVDIVDEDESTINSFLKAIRKFKASKLSEEKIICYFIEALLSEGNKIAEELRNNLTDMEEAIVNKTVTEEFNTDLLCLKKKILKYYHCHNLFPAYDYRRLVWNEFPKYA